MHTEKPGVTWGSRSIKDLCAGALDVLDATLSRVLGRMVGFGVFGTYVVFPEDLFEANPRLHPCIVAAQGIGGTIVTYKVFKGLGALMLSPHPKNFG